jgi:hypothetical protein
MDPERETTAGNALVLMSRATAAASISAIPIIGGPVATFLTEIAIQRLQRTMDLLTEVVEAAARDHCKDTDAFLEDIDQRPELRSLLSAGFEAASSTEDEHLRQIASRLLREGLADDSAVDECRLLVSTLRQLEPVHLRVFGMIANSRLFLEQAAPKSVQLPMTFDALLNAWPAGKFVLPAILAVLEGAGLIRSDMFSVDWLRHPERYKPRGPKLTTDNQTGWAPTPYGFRLHRFIDA